MPLPSADRIVNSAPSRERPHLAACPLCSHSELEYQFTHTGTAIVRCEGCGLTMRNPQPSDAELGEIYHEHYFLGSGANHEGLVNETGRLKRATASAYLDLIEARFSTAPIDRRTLRLLEVGCGHGNLLVESQARGYDVTGIEYSESSVRAANANLGATRVFQGSIDTVSLPEQSFDVAVLADVIEHTRNPLDDLTRLWQLLKPGGLLFIALPSLDSWSARLMRTRWMEFKLEHLFFFDRQTIQSRCFVPDSARCRSRRDGRRSAPNTSFSISTGFPSPWSRPPPKRCVRSCPAPFAGVVSVVASGIDVIARRSAELPQRLRTTVCRS